MQVNNENIADIFCDITQFNQQSLANYTHFIPILLKKSILEIEQSAIQANESIELKLMSLTCSTIFVM